MIDNLFEYNLGISIGSLAVFLKEAHVRGSGHSNRFQIIIYHMQQFIVLNSEWPNYCWIGACNKGWTEQVLVQLFKFTNWAMRTCFRLLIMSFLHYIVTWGNIMCSWIHIFFRIIKLVKSLNRFILCMVWVRYHKNFITILIKTVTLLSIYIKL